MKITMVKKVLDNGAPCKKCVEVEKRLKETGLMGRIDEVLIADVNNPVSPGMIIAGQYNVDRAPFFVVEHENGRVEVYTVFFKLLREVLEPEKDDEPLLSHAR